MDTSQIAKRAYAAPILSKATMLATVTALPVVSGVADAPV